MKPVYSWPQLAYDVGSLHVLPGADCYGDGVDDGRRFAVPS
jgi:hypothetical protein